MEPQIRRNSALIIGDILRFAEAPKTRHRAKLSGRRLQEYLDFMVDDGLLEEVCHDGRVSFRRTEKGVRLLRQIDNLHQMLVV